MGEKQREVFLRTEGDEWYKRNRNYDTNGYVEKDPICIAVENIADNINGKANLVEVGCSDGRRLKALKTKYDWSYKGVEPSTKAIESGISDGNNIVKGSADRLPIEDKSVDILIYGFCLYLCDRDDLFLISAEGNRVTKDKSWIIIHDFWANKDITNNYHHRKNIKSYKTKPEEMYSWHPSYTVMDTKIRDITTNTYTDEQSNWVKTSVIRKYIEIPS